ncbi:unnamed protein product [Camellia sinensis]
MTTPLLVRGYVVSVMVSSLVHAAANRCFFPPKAFKRMQWVETVEEMQQFLMVRCREKLHSRSTSMVKLEDRRYACDQVLTVLKTASLLGFSWILVFATLPRHSTLNYFSLLQTFVNRSI